MDDNRRYEAFVRNRITELREQKGISEHRMSLELGKSGSYIRSITNGISMPSLRELFNIMEYFDLTPTLFFAPMDDPDSLRGIIGILWNGKRYGELPIFRMPGVAQNHLDHIAHVLSSVSMTDFPYRAIKTA